MCVCTQTTHKGSANPILNWYYSFPYLLICCVGNEGFFVALYIINKIGAGPEVVGYPLFTTLAWVFMPISALKNFLNVVQLYDAANIVADLDLKEKLTAKSA